MRRESQPPATELQARTTARARNRYYNCSNHDVQRAGGPERRCTERRIRADELDAFVFDQMREILLRPDVLLAGEQTLVSREPTLDDEILDAQLAASRAASRKPPLSAAGSPTSIKPATST